MAEQQCVQSFFENSVPPENYTADTDSIKKFVEKHKEINSNIVLVTSGGTTVPLESQTVRYIDNFSIGNRGAISTEYFLDNGYAVIFLHRRGSLEPYRRHLQNVDVLDMLALNGQTVTVKTEHAQHIAGLLQKYIATKEAGRLLSITFTTLSDYLYLLQASSMALSTCGRLAMFYLAAAVSDFYIPSSNMSEHKIQSSNGPLDIHLQLVPKVLRPLVSQWVPSAFVVSFKLETDANLLLKKSHQALENYRHQAVIGNILKSRKTEVVLVTSNDEKWIKLSVEEVNSGVEIEKYIVASLVSRHSEHITRDIM